MEEVRERLKKYNSGKHGELLIAAKDDLLPTSDLIEISKAIIVSERANNEEGCDYLPLMILHKRPTENTLNKSIDLLKSDDSIDRELGCRILREFPSLDQAPTKFSEQIISSVSQLFEKEEDENVLLSAMTTIDWQCHNEGHKILLNMSSDSRDNVRYVVANNLLTVFDDNQKITTECANIFLKFAKDPEEDIRLTVFYEIAEYPHIFSDFKEEFKAVAQYAKNDSSLEVRSNATRAFNAL